MSCCIYDDGGICTCKNMMEVYGQSCIEKNNPIDLKQIHCKYHVDEVPSAVNKLWNASCLYRYQGKCANDMCIHCGKECATYNTKTCSCFIPADIFKKQEKQETPKTSDNVEHPSHYCQGGIECIKAIEASMTPEGFQDYCKGNVLKYTWRWREKNGLEDLKKAQVYLGWMIESKEKQEANHA